MTTQPALRESAQDMLDVIFDPDATTDECEQAVATLVEIIALVAATRKVND